MSEKLRRIKYEDPVELSIEISLEKIEKILSRDYPVSGRAIGLLLLQGDSDIINMVKEKEPGSWAEVEKIIEETKAHYRHPLEYVITMRRQQEVSQIIASTVTHGPSARLSFGEVLSRLMMNPWTGLPILALILYFGLYKLVGAFGAGVVVDFLESKVFEEFINPFVTGAVQRIIPWQIFRELLAGEYGVITLGVRYAVAIILPIVAIFFMAFSVIEDTGYLPRLAMLIDRTFKKIGLSGRAVIPMVLGFGCDTMATMVTRTLPTKRERIIATMLLSLAIPCSAQLGVIFAILHTRPLALFVWAFVIGIVFLFIGYLTAKILPGERPSFYMEISPLRLPSLSNIWQKTYIRVAWYVREVLPLFILASALIWLGQLTKIFDLFIFLLIYPVRIIGLPDEAARIFLFGFFRRDYGAAGLYDLNQAGILSLRQLVVAGVALTLFLPCIAQFLMNIKERGYRAGLGISGFVLVFSFCVAYLLNIILGIVNF